MVSLRHPARRSRSACPARRTPWTLRAPAPRTPRGPRAARILTGIAIAALLSTTAAGCALGHPARQSARPPAPSAWQLTLDRVHRNGHVTTATALAAFALAIGHVPGARPVTGPAQVIPSGTVAVQWTLGHWRQLTASQRRAVLAALGVRPRAAARTTAQLTPARGTPARGTPARPAIRLLAAEQPAAATSPDISCLTADTAGAGPYRAQAAAIERDIAAHAGAGPFSPDVYFSVNATQLEGRRTKMYTYGCTGSQVTRDGPVQGCTIHVNPTVSGGSFPAAEVQDFLIHELTHCYEFQKLGAAYYHLPAWYGEGVPTWAMTVLGNGSNIESSFWLSYLNTPGTPVFQRSYSALGFFVHLAETGTDVWHKILPMGQALTSGGNAAGWQAAAPGTRFLDSWGSGYAEGRYPGTAWQSTGPNLPHYQGPVPQASLGNGHAITVSSPAAATAISKVDIDAQIVLVTGSGNGRISLDGGADATLAQAAAAVYSTAGASARCPAGTPNAGTKLTQISSGAHYVTVTGGLTSAAVHVQGLSLDSFCARKTAACIVGNWTSTRFQATIPGLASEHGGAGVTMKIGSDGSVTVDFSPMAPIDFDGTADTQGAGPITASFTFGGRVSGQIRIPAGNPGATRGAWHPVPGSPIVGSLTATMHVTSPVSETIGPLPISELTGSMGANSSAVNDHPLSKGTYSCTGNTLTNYPPASAPAVGTWTWARTG